MKKWVKIVIGILIIGVIAGVFAYRYVMTGGARHIEEEQAAYSVTAENLAGEFSKNEQAALKKYLNKAVEVSGTVTESAPGSTTLNGGVICTLHDSTATAIPKDKAMIFKGRVVGYDDLMQEVRLDECFITETKK